MCGRYAIFTEEENQEIREIISEINERYKQDSSGADRSGQNSSAPARSSLMKTGEIFPTDIVPIITRDSHNKKVVNLFKWGFPVYRQPSGVIINARSESLHEKPTFRNLMRSGRCLVPASGFYEWHKNSDHQKDKYLIRSSESRLMYFAGLYNNFIDKNTEENGISTRFVIITTEANDQMSRIHTRMPVILNSDEAAAWIAPGDIEIPRFLKPYGSQLTFYQV